VIDEHSIGSMPYFEDELANIHVGDLVEATLLGFKLRSRKDRSITSGISAATRQQHRAFHNVDQSSPGSSCATISGAYQNRTSPPQYRSLQEMTCSVSVVGRKGNAGAGRDRRLFYQLVNLP